jgi:hypothetical protein
VTNEALPATISAAYLTEVLHRAGVLAGSVREIVVEQSRAMVLSRIIRLRLTYDGDVAGAPPTLIFKTALPDRTGPEWHAGPQEVAFYTLVAPGVANGVVPRCFDAQATTAGQPWHLLLEDLTDSHATPTAWPLPPSAAQCERVVQAFARFHAAWWDDARLGVSVGVWRDVAWMQQLLQRFAAVFADFIDRHGDRMPAERRAQYERFLDAAPRLLQRYHTHRNLTVVHGDAHFWNCFLPHAADGDVLLFDWDSWRLGEATGDLAYMMAMHWYPDRRRRLEQLLLDRYHATLLAEGVRDYDRQALDDDYRLSVLWHITTPVWQSANRIPPVIWWNNLERILLAVDDLDCRALL